MLFNSAIATISRKCCLLAVLAFALNLPAQTGRVLWDKPVEKSFVEPEWFKNGIVFVGNWEPLNFRLRKGAELHDDPLPVDIEERYRQEHSEETVVALKQAGVNFVTTHFYKTGLVSDRESIEDTKRFVRLCLEVYNVAVINLR